MSGGTEVIEPASFRNDMKNIDTSDDVMTLLVHLGYLSYEPETQQVRIPNTEVAIEFKNAVSVAGWDENSNTTNLPTLPLTKFAAKNIPHRSKVFQNKSSSAVSTTTNYTKEPYFRRIILLCSNMTNTNVKKKK